MWIGNARPCSRALWCVVLWCVADWCVAERCGAEWCVVAGRAAVGCVAVCRGAGRAARVGAVWCCGRRAGALLDGASEVAAGAVLAAGGIGRAWVRDAAGRALADGGATVTGAPGAGAAECGVRGCCGRAGRRWAAAGRAVCTAAGTSAACPASPPVSARAMPIATTAQPATATEAASEERIRAVDMKPVCQM
jgi:hypothetical protein